jgi:hypothetical protein
MNRFLLPALLLACVAGPALAQAPPIAQLPAVKVGDVAVYAVHLRSDNKRTEETITVTHADASQIRTRNARPERPAATEGVYDAQWNPTVSSNSGARFEPAARTLSFPLEQGKSWDSRYSVTGANFTARGDAANKVVGYEKVATPAGEFDAWKVETAGWINGVSFQGAFRFVQTLWYAPSIGRMVRMDYKESRRDGQDNLFELKSFKPAP